MADTYLQGIVGALGIQPEVINDISQFLATMFVPETPLMSLLRRSPVGSVTFTWVNSKPRPRTNTVGTGGIDNQTTTTSLPVADASMYMVGDMLLIESELVEVTADPTLGGSPETVTVRRAAAGTTAAAHTSGTAITNLGNSRSGSEVNQSAVRMVRSPTTQYCQTWQFPVQVGGSAQSSTNIVLPAGIRDLFTDAQVEALRNLKRDQEYSSLYGLGEAPSTTNSRPKQKGLKTLITTNKVTSPTNAGAYTPSDFIRDTTQAIRDNGGDPTVALVSTGFAAGLAKWGMNVQRVQAGETEFGVPIESFLVPFLGPITFYEHQQLGSATNHTCCMLTEQEAQFRAKRNEFWSPRGSRGDAMEGDYIGEGAVELVNEAHHAWVEGITAFAAP